MIDLMSAFKIVEKGIDTAKEYFPSEEARNKAEAEGKRKVIEMAQKGELEFAKIDAKDRESARKREMALGGKMNGTLALLIMGGFFSVVGALGFLAVPDGNKDVLYMLLGSLGTMSTQVIAYYFGSSKGSKDKTQLMK